MSADVVGHRPFTVEVGAKRLERWIIVGIRKQFPTETAGQSDAKVFEHFSYHCARYETKYGFSQEAQDQFWAEIVARFKAIGHTVDTL